MLSLEVRQLGNYDVTRRIRVGGMGAVYEGRQRTAFGRRVAIKVILGDYATDRDMRRRFAREAKIVARLHHPHILPLIEFGDEQGILYLVMPFIDGGTLTSYLRHNLPGLGDVSAIYQQLLDAVEYAHDQGLIHRDIKSSNVLLELHRNTPPYVYLADFGLVRTKRPDEASQVGKPIPLEQVPGTPHYMAPEQTMGIVTPLTDIYALGVLLYQMLTGNLPYNDPDEVRVIQMHLHDPIPSPCEYDASVPLELGEVVRTAMTKHPEERYQSVAELRNAFLQALKGPSNPLPVTEDVDPIESVEPEIIESSRPRTTKVLRKPVDPPRPIVMPQHARGSGVSDKYEGKYEETYFDYAPPPPRRTAHLDKATRVHTTETFQRPRSPRITEEPVPPRRRKRFIFPVLAVLVALFLMGLLVVSRARGLVIAPPNVPVLGSSSVATVSITANSKTLQNTFLLTAAPQVKAPDLNAHTIPDRVIQSTVEANSSVATTGNNMNQGQKAQGFIVLINTNDNAVQVHKGMVLNARNGVQVQLSQDVTVPAKQGNQPGKISASAIAVQPGQAGNIAANFVSGTCCKPILYTSNPAAFVGGVDPDTTHFVTQNDIDGAKNSLVPRLEQQLKSQLQGKMASGETMLGQPDYQVTVNSDNPVNAQANNVLVTVKVSANVAAYKKDVAVQTAMVLLNRQAQNDLGAAYQLQGKQSVFSFTVDTGKNDVAYLKVAVQGVWAYTFTDDQIKKLRDPIKGTTLNAAKTYLQTQPGVAKVDIHLPFGVDHLPTSTDNIDIMLDQKNSNS